jgi:hypothetical protein
MVMLRSRTGVDFLPGASRFSGVNGSKFDIRGVSPGSYTLMSAMSDRGTSYSGRLDLDIADRDLTGIALPLNPGLDLPGEIVVEDNAQIDLTTLRVSLQGTNTSSLMTGAGTAGGGPSQFTFGTQASDKVGADGKFTLHNLFPDASRPTITPLPNGFYVKSIKFGEQEVLESGLDLSRGAGAALKITLSGQAGNITGTVNGDDGNPFSGATVVLIPKSDARRAVSQFYRNASSNQQGQFTFRNLDPGDYKIYAWEDVENSAWMDPEFVKPYESKATEVTLAPAGQQQLQLKTIPPPK